MRAAKRDQAIWVRGIGEPAFSEKLRATFTQDTARQMDLDDIRMPCIPTQPRSQELVAPRLLELWNFLWIFC